MSPTITCGAKSRVCRTAPLGQPLRNLQLYVVDSVFEPLPAGVPGEVLIGGTGVGRGYWNRAELTAEKFVPDTLSGRAGERLYRTGDLGRWLPDGTLDFIGRIDHQVKVRGFRIELGEIESALRQCAGVREAVVVARGASGETRLAGYVSGAHLQVTELRRQLQLRLPDYMVPQAFVLLEKLPLTPNGKVDRRALPEPETLRLETASQYEAPRTEIEEKLAEIWAQVLGLERVGVHDNFFELGGDSILTLQLVARAREAGLHLTTRQLFQNQTVAVLAEVAEASVEAQEVHAVRGPVPLTPIQRWFFEQDFGDAQHWNQAVMMATDEPLDGAALEGAVNRVVAHHDALAMRFEHGPEGWRQIAGEAPAAAVLERVHLSCGTCRRANCGRLSSGSGAGTSWIGAGARPAGPGAVDGPGSAGQPRAGGNPSPGGGRGVMAHPAGGYRVRLRQAPRGEAVRLPAKSLAFGRWAERLAEYGRTTEIRRELDYWNGQRWDEVGQVPVDWTGAENTEGSAAVVGGGVEPGPDPGIVAGSAPGVPHGDQ